MRLPRASAAFVFLAALAAAQDSLPTGRVTSLKRSWDFDWKASTTLPPGTEYHLIREDPVTRGVQAVVRFPAGYKLPPHSHDADETLVILKGKLLVKAGADELLLSSRDYAVLPAGVEHEMTVKSFGECWALLTTSGPYTVKKP